MRNLSNPVLQTTTKKIFAESYASGKKPIGLGFVAERTVNIIKQKYQLNLKHSDDKSTKCQQVLLHYKGKEGIHLSEYHNINKMSGEAVKRKQSYEKLHLSRQLR